MPLLKPMGGMFLLEAMPPHMFDIWELFRPAPIPPIPISAAMPGITLKGLFIPEPPDPFSRAEHNNIQYVL